MPQYKIVNPSAGDVYYDNAGSARTITTATVGSGTIKGLGGDQTGETDSSHGINRTQVGSTVPSGLSRTEAAQSAGTFGTMTAAKYIIRRVTTTLGEVSNTTLQFGGPSLGKVRSIHGVKSSMRHSAVATAIRDGYWNEFSGAFSTAATATNNSIADASGNVLTDGTADDEANVSRAQQGEFTYRDHSKTVVFGQYGAKKG